MRRLLTGSLALLCALLATPAVGQTPAAAAPPAQPIRQVDFDAAVKQAIERNPSVAAAATSIDRAEALLQGTRSAIRPTVSGSIASTAATKCFSRKSRECTCPSSTRAPAHS